MPTYTLIHYRPNLNIYRSGYHEGGSDSEIEIISYGDDHKPVVADIARKILFNAIQSSEYADWETTLLIDGYLQGDSPAYEQGAATELALLEEAKYEAIEKRAWAMFVEMKNEHDEKERIRQEAEAKKKALDAEYAASDKEMKEWAQYKQLHAKYGSQS